MSQDLELGVCDAQGLLLQRKREAVGDEKANQVTGRTDRQIAELEGLGRPRREGLLPGQIEQTRSASAQPQPRETGGGNGRRPGQSFFRRYAVTVES